MTKKLYLWIGLAVLVGGAGAGVYLNWRAGERREMAVASLPKSLDLQGKRSEFVIRVTDAQRRVRAGEGTVSALAELASLFYSNGYLADAAHCYRGLVRIEPSNPRWSHLLANILAGFGQLDDAVLLWRHTLRLESDYTAAQIHLGDSLLKLNQAKEAKEMYDRILERQPENAYALLGLARIDMEAGRWTEARECLEKAVASSDYSVGYDLLVTVYEHLGENAKAEAVRARFKASGAFVDPPDPWLRDTFADCYDSYQLSLAGGTTLRQGDLPAAIGFVERAIVLDPNVGYYYVQLEELYQHQGDDAKALQALQTGTAKDPACSDAWHQLVLVLRKAGQKEQAYRAMMAGLSHCPKSASLHYVFGEYLISAGNLEEAIPHFQFSASCFKDDASPHMQLAKIYFSLNRSQEGLEAVRNALQAEPETPGALMAISLYYITTRNETEARKWMQHVKAQPRVPPAERLGLENAFSRQFGSVPY